VIPALKDALKTVETWPEENQPTLAAAAREIEAQMTGFIRAVKEGRGADTSGGLAFGSTH
jgi:ClpP class serine protease